MKTTRVLDLDANQLFRSRPRFLKPDMTPWLWLARLDKADGTGNEFELHLVNASPHILERVTSAVITTITLDDQAFGSCSADYVYEQVLPGQSVKLDESDGYYDLDYYMTVSIDIDAPALGGRLHFCPALHRGGARPQILHAVPK